jgi:endonuclease III
MRQQLLAWWEPYGRHAIPWKQGAAGGRPLPGEELDPYSIWIAEVMLQQTQLAVVLPYWQRWLAALPSLDALAAAPEHDLFLLWQGLGYYARARRLKQGASQLLAARWPGDRQSADRQSGVRKPMGIEGAGGDGLPGDPWPRTVEGWMELPGIGRTTAGSILSSAYDQPAAILDGNVKRVLARLNQDTPVRLRDAMGSALVARPVLRAPTASRIALGPDRMATPTPLWTRPDQGPTAANGRLRTGVPGTPQAVSTHQRPAFLADDPAVEKACSIIRRAVRMGVPVLIQGETGTGKEVIARHAHEFSGRKGAFVGVHCGALPAELVEAELFGYVAGAFTGARREGSAGLIASADGGTLLLDEIAELPLALQSSS